MSADASDLPTGIKTLHWTGDGPAPIQRILDDCEPESDPERRGAQVLLALARQVLPDADLAGLVAFTAKLMPRAAELDPTLVADVARRMGIA